MKRLLLSTAALALVSTGALAADLPIIEPVQEVLPVPVVTSWSGFYIGLHGGYGWADIDADLDEDDDDEDDLFDFDDDDDLFDSELDGPVIGGQLGFNVQVNSFLFGIEADGSWSGIDDDEDTFDDDDDIPGFSAEVDWLASVRGRVGLAWDRFLVYGTGGVAFAEFSTDLEDDGDFFDDDDDDLFDDDDDDDGETEVGVVYGGGAEFLVTDNVSFGVEYLHYDFDDVDAPDFVVDVAGADDVEFTTEADADVDVIRGRVNVKFGSLFGAGG